MALETRVQDKVIHIFGTLALPGLPRIQAQATVLPDFKHRVGLPGFPAWCAGRGLRSLRAVSAQSAICREDRLFELADDASQPALAI